MNKLESTMVRTNMSVAEPSVKFWTLEPGRRPGERKERPRALAAGPSRVAGLLQHRHTIKHHQAPGGKASPGRSMRRPAQGEALLQRNSPPQRKRVSRRGWTTGAYEIPFTMENVTPGPTGGTS